MSKDDDQPGNPDDPAASEAKKVQDAAQKDKKATDDKENLDEGLDESMAGSDAPASTRRSSKD